MDDLLEILELPVDVYAEYWGAMWYLARESPLYAAAYVVIAVILALLLIRWLRSRPMTFKRTYSGCFALALLVLPGAVGQGGLAILPLVVIIAFSVIQPHQSRALLRRQIRDVHRHVDRREPGLHGLQLGGIGHGLLLGRSGTCKRAKRGHHSERETHRNLGFLQSDIGPRCLSLRRSCFNSAPGGKSG